jgi:hypothetical protein
MQAFAGSTRLNGALAALLPPWQRRWHAMVFVVLNLIGADTLFLLAHRGVRLGLAATEWSSGESGFYQASVLLHSLIGYTLALLLMIFACLHVPAMVRRMHGRWLLVGLRRVDHRLLRVPPVLGDVFPFAREIRQQCVALLVTHGRQRRIHCDLRGAPVPGR